MRSYLPTPQLGQDMTQGHFLISSVNEEKGYLFNFNQAAPSTHSRGKM